jgi:hypothetical protein
MGKFEIRTEKIMSISNLRIKNKNKKAVSERKI